MRIQHNIAAMNSAIQNKNTLSNVSKSQEKLSSGLKINRAADNAAGLSISEKMRRQIRGLGRAVKNGEDGIGLSQIADGALAEVHDMLQRGNELAIQAANGTLSDSDRVAVNNEITQLKKEIDSITSRTKFNELNVFVKDGVLPPLPTQAKEKLIPDDYTLLSWRIANEYYPNAVEQIANAFPSLGDAVKKYAEENGVVNTTLFLDYIDGLDGTNKIAAMMGITHDPMKNGKYNYKLELYVDDYDFPPGNLTQRQKDYLEVALGHETMHGFMQLTYYAANDNNMWSQFPDWFVEGTAQLAGGGMDKVYSIQYMVRNLSNADSNQADEGIANYLKLPEKAIDENVYGTGFLAAAYSSYLAADGNDVTRENILNGANKIFQSLIDTDSTFEDTFKQLTGITPDELKDAFSNGSTDSFSTTPEKVSVVEFVRRFIYNSKDGRASFIADSLTTGGEAVLHDTADPDAQPMKIFSVKESYLQFEDTRERGGYNTVSLHLGTDADMPNKIQVNLFKMDCDALKLTDTNVLTMDKATSAIDEFGDAIMMVSSVRSYYGAIQNRIEHTIMNLNNVIENTTSAESRLRDTDMAEEIANYHKHNLLQQAGQAMLTQANQTPQGVLGLLS
ncbi:flagellinolysin [Butyrivibrio sp. AC2005]|uniref:flagellinolysin n=1 Tax=Butyrivibrio sp. AC2005 TaxID=1280672 RepID=UPI0004065493|nr:flagellinolysin [Butyrivibrio sp. AC2005]